MCFRFFVCRFSFSKIFFQEYIHSVKHSSSRSGTTLCIQTDHVISRRHQKVDTLLMYSFNKKSKIGWRFTFCLLGNFPCAFLSSVEFLLNQLFRNTIRVSKNLDSDQALFFVGPDLCPDCLQRLSADDTSR